MKRRITPEELVAIEARHDATDSLKPIARSHIDRGVLLCALTDAERELTETRVEAERLLGLVTRADGLLLEAMRAGRKLKVSRKRGEHSLFKAEYGWLIDEIDDIRQWLQDARAILKAAAVPE